MKISFIAAWCAALTFGLSTDMRSATPPKDIDTVVKMLDIYMDKAMEATGVPGAAVAIVYQDKVAFLKGYGVRKLTEEAKVDADTVFQLASLSKPIASTIVASLIKAGRIEWDDPVRKFDPGFTLSNPVSSEKVTLKDLFSHRSGIPTGGGDVLEDLGYSRPGVLSRLRFVPLAGELGKTYHYSNFGLTEAAIAVSMKVGKPWETIAEEQLYAKLGMSSTSSRFSDYQNNPNKAAIHVAECNSDGKCVFRNRFLRDADAESPAGGVSSSARDLANWLRLQLAGGTFDGVRVVAEKELEETHKAVICKSVPVVPAGGKCPNNSFYGLGWGATVTSWGAPMSSHSGAFLLGVGTAVYMVPSEQIGIIVLGNSTPVGLPEAAALTFLDYFHYGVAQNDYLALVGPVFADLRNEAQNSSPNYSTLKPPLTPKPSKALSTYTGKYASMLYGTLEISLEHDQLIMRLPPRGAYYELEHWDGDIFTHFFATENSGIARRGVKFSPKQVLIESLAIDNNGIFTKIE